MDRVTFGVTTVLSFPVSCFLSFCCPPSSSFPNTGIAANSRIMTIVMVAFGVPMSLDFFPALTFAFFSAQQDAMGGSRCQTKTVYLAFPHAFLVLGCIYVWFCGIALLAFILSLTCHRRHQHFYPPLSAKGPMLQPY